MGIDGGVALEVFETLEKSERRSASPSKTENVSSGRKRAAEE